MPIHERPVDHGARRARYLVSRTASELTIARRRAGLSQRELGRHLRISHSTIGRAERGEPGLLTIELAAKMAQFWASSSRPPFIPTAIQYAMRPTWHSSIDFDGDCRLP